MPKSIGRYVVDGVECEAKMDDHGTYVTVYSTVAGEDLPISGSQVHIPKEIVKKIYSSTSGGCQS